jgi:hypothetical protein
VFLYIVLCFEIVNKNHERLQNLFKISVWTSICKKGAFVISRREDFRCVSVCWIRMFSILVHCHLKKMIRYENYPSTKAVMINSHEYFNNSNQMIKPNIKLVFLTCKCGRIKMHSVDLKYGRYWQKLELSLTFCKVSNHELISLLLFCSTIKWHVSGSQGLISAHYLRFFLLVIHDDIFWADNVLWKAFPGTWKCLKMTYRIPLKPCLFVCL